MSSDQFEQWCSRQFQLLVQLLQEPLELAQLQQAMLQGLQQELLQEHRLD